MIQCGKLARGVLFYCGLILLTQSCQQEGAQDFPGFTPMKPEDTGVDFVNRITSTLDLNILTYMYFYNGGGVATGDFNQDGQLDIYFTANQEPNRLYINEGDFRFREVSEISGVEGVAGWATGVALADVNADGRLDIYVSQLGEHERVRGRNQLYINLGNDPDGNPVFEDRAALYNLDLVGYGTQATFFDYDRDGDLDLFQLNHSVHQKGTFGIRSTFDSTYDDRAGDRLFRNDGRTFTEVTRESGIRSNVLGYGLGVAVSDFNRDGWADIYVGNDFHEDDYLYLNNGDGTFTDAGATSLPHTSRFSMGNDAGDINNDGYPDLISLDMLPHDPEILKASETEIAYDLYDFRLGYGYGYQYSRNTLQLNLGKLPGEKGVRFSDVGLLSGVAATDWSWSGLLADFDQDGKNDLFVANGIVGRPNDLDFINYVTEEETKIRIHFEEARESDLELIETMPQIKVPNFMFRNEGELAFRDVSAEWGLNQNSYSNGAAYADLDNDGDLDLVINNINQPAFLLRNELTQSKLPDRHFLQIKLEGGAKNPFGIGARIEARLGDEVISREQYLSRGFQSSVSPLLHLGLGKDSLIPELVVIWPDGKCERKKEVQTDQVITLRYADAQEDYAFPGRDDTPCQDPIFSPLPSPAFVHRENKFVEFNREPLIPHMNATEGPALAVGDINGDGREDFFVGGAKEQAGEVFFQSMDGSFTLSDQPALRKDKQMEDVDAVWVDADGNQSLDLLVASGGNEFPESYPQNAVRLYLNDGKGGLKRSPDHLPEITLTASCILTVDIEKDGDMDFFVGGRAVPYRYGEPPASYLLINQGNGKFKERPLPVSTYEKGLGFIRDGVWADMNGDGWEDLVLAREWDTPLILWNEKGELSFEVDMFTGQEGWWSSVEAADLDQDGDLDLLLGNMGQNARLKASEQEPVTLYYDDFDGNGSKEQILTHYHQGKEMLFATKDELSTQLPYLKKKFLKYQDFAQADFNTIFPKAKLENARKYVARNMRSMVVWNKGNGQFSWERLPLEAQFSPIEDFMVKDFDGDGNLDVLAVGNFYESNLQMGRYDASMGNLLKADGQGGFVAVDVCSSGFWVEGQGRRLRNILGPNGEMSLLIARNKDSLLRYRWNNGPSSPSMISKSSLR